MNLQFASEGCQGFVNIIIHGGYFRLILSCSQLIEVRPRAFPEMLFSTIGVCPCGEPWRQRSVPFCQSTLGFQVCNQGNPRIRDIFPILATSNPSIICRSLTRMSAVM